LRTHETSSARAAGIEIKMAIETKIIKEGRSGRRWMKRS
jgi:hypothetical protein